MSDRDWELERGTFEILFSRSSSSLCPVIRLCHRGGGVDGDMGATPPVLLLPALADSGRHSPGAEMPLGVTALPSGSFQCLCPGGCF